ncbi:MAG: hypothetical protein IT452_05965 [Planctomycetia bacterium]|nr:hypothetical protein [Planctomycetia bacterium]
MRRFVLWAAMAAFARAEGASLVEAARLRSAGDLKGARAALEAVLADGESAEARAELGAVLLELDRPEAAEAELARALEAEPRADTAFNLAIARYRQKNWAGAWFACGLCLKWAEKGSRLQERAAEIGYAIARRLDGWEAKKPVYEEIAKWAPDTEAGKKAAGELR